MNDGMRLVEEHVETVINAIAEDWDYLIDGGDLDDFIFECMDSQMIWTHDNWAICRDYRGDIGFLEDWGGNLDQKIGGYAYQIVRQEVYDKVHELGWYERWENGEPLDDEDE